ncbi:PCL1 [[Candida] subhashii]|uniref:PCL1 n=1 Tax=[Candida] subhashii TaxID=561895 RepID=A0A8J5UN29_9ASCO|nr:PCL1 [[Candida] subhashii]KAG7663541.1 PCL1 [[Candida] subhashii]
MASTLDLKALQTFLSGPVTHDMIHKLVVATLQVIPCKDTKNSTYTTPDNITKPLPSLMTFLTKLVKQTNVYTGTLMATLVYLNRLKMRLPKNSSGLPCTRHRILLSCLILSSKFHNDSSPKNKHWAEYTDGLFSTRDINLMERQLVFLLNWDTRVSNEEMIYSLDSFLEPIRYDIIKTSKMRKFISRQQQQNQQQQVQQQYQQHLHIPRSQSPRQAPPVLEYTSSSYPPSTPSCSSTHSRASSVTSFSPSSRNNYSHLRSESIQSISPEPPREMAYSNKVDPIIEFTALKEEMELKSLLKSLNAGSYAAQQMTYVYN